MVGRRRVAERHAAAPVLAADDLLRREGFARLVAPHLPPHESVHGFGEGFRQPVGQQFGHDRRVVVALGAEFLREFFQPDAGRHGETADPVAGRGDEVGQRPVLLPARLVAEHREAFFAAPGVRHPDVVALGARREDAHDALQRQQPFVADAGQQRLRIVEDLAGLGAPLGMVEYLGITPLEPPRREEEVPVDERLGVGHVEVREDHAPRVERFYGIVRPDAPPRLAGLGERQQVAFAHFAGVLFAQGLLIGFYLVDVGAAVGTQQLREYLAVAAGVRGVDHRTRVDRGDLDGRVEVRGRRAADDDRDAQRAAFEFLADVGHLVERRRDQTAQADALRAPRHRLVNDAFRFDHHAQVPDFIAVAGHHDRHDVLADVVHVAFHGGDQHFPGLVGLRGRPLFEVGRQGRHGAFHHPGGLHDLG